MAGDFGNELVFPCNVAQEADINNLFAELEKHWNKFDGFNRDAFRTAHDISAYSFSALAKASLPYLNEKSAILTLSYLGAIRTMPHYNVMGMAKKS